MKKKLLLATLATLAVGTTFSGTVLAQTEQIDVASQQPQTIESRTVNTQVRYNNVIIRSGPGTNHKALGQVHQGTVVYLNRMIAPARDSAGHLWYPIWVGNKAQQWVQGAANGNYGLSGWIRSDLIGSF